MGQWWGVSPGGRLGASLCVFGEAFLLAGDGNERLDTCDRMMESLTLLQSAPTVRIKCAKGEKSAILSISSAEGPQEPSSVRTSACFTLHLAFPPAVARGVVNGVHTE